MKTISRKPKFRVEFRFPYSLISKPLESDWISIEKGSDSLIVRTRSKQDGDEVLLDRYVLLKRIARVVSRALLLPHGHDDDEDDDDFDETTDLPPAPTREVPISELIKREPPETQKGYS